MERSVDSTVSRVVEEVEEGEEDEEEEGEEEKRYSSGDFCESVPLNRTLQFETNCAKATSLAVLAGRDSDSLARATKRAETRSAGREKLACVK